MADDKKGFLLYSDILGMVKSLPREKAGDLFVTILEYVNNLNPDPEDLVLKIAFEPIKMQLKRDLKNYEKEIERRSSSGRLGGLRSAEKRKESKQIQAKASSATKKQPKPSTLKHPQANQADNDNVNDNVNEIRGKKPSQKIPFALSTIFDKKAFADAFPGWPKKKLRHYWESADRYSTEGNKYIDWVKAISGWAAKAELNGERWTLESTTPTHCPYTADQINEAKKSFEAFNSYPQWFDKNLVPKELLEA